jgi:hypothetical protein
VTAAVRADFGDQNGGIAMRFLFVALALGALVTPATSDARQHYRYSLLVRWLVRIKQAITDKRWRLIAVREQIVAVSARLYDGSRVRQAGSVIVVSRPTGCSMARRRLAAS